jgi:O-antigen/teichoic acid export membrane protein
LIARTFGPALFSLYAILGVITAITSIVADFGLTEAATKRVASTWSQHALDTADKQGRVFFWARMSITVLIVLLGSLFAGIIANVVYGLSQVAPFIVLAFVGVGAAGLSGSVTALLQATGYFGRMTIIILTNAVLTTLLAVLLFLMEYLTLLSAMVVLGIGTSFVSFIVGYALLPKPLTLRLPDFALLRREAPSLFRFGFWLWIANILSALTTYLDIFLVNRLLAPSVVGVYALALNLIAKIAIVNRGQRIVLMPTASALVNNQAIAEYTRRELIHSAGLSLLLVPLIPLIDPFVNLVYGSEYAAAILLFRLLLGVVAFDILTLPLLLLTYTFDQPQVLTISNAIQVMILLVLSIVLIPSYGLVGVILARLISKVGGTLFALTRVFSLYRAGAASPAF